MQPTSHVPALAGKLLGPRLEALLPLVAGTALVALIGLLAGQVEWVVEVGWFEDQHYGYLAARWVSVFAVALLLWGMATVLRALAGASKRSAVLE